jgi:hypothetical protein
MQKFLVKASWLISVNMFYFENKFLGLLSFKYNNKLKIFETCRLSLLYCICFNLFLVVCFPVRIFQTFFGNSMAEEGLVSILTYFGNLILNYVMTMVTILSYLPNQSEIVNIVNECYRLFLIFGDKKDVNNKYVQKYMAKFTFKYFVFFMVTWDLIQLDLFNFVLLQSQTMMFFIITFNYFIFMLLVNYVLENLSIVLADFIKTHQNDREQLVTSKKHKTKMNVDLAMCDKLEKIVVLYERIGKNTDKINKIYSVILLVTVGLVFYKFATNVS